MITLEMPSEVVDKARTRMNKLLFGRENLQYPVILENDSRITNKGSHGWVFTLGDCGSKENPFYCVGKVVFQRESDKISRIGCVVGIFPSSLEETVKSLREFNIPVADAVEFVYRFGRSKGSFIYHLCPDLSWNGKYEVFEASDNTFGSLENGVKLKEDFDRMVGTITSRTINRWRDVGRYKNAYMNDYVLEPDNHVGEGRDYTLSVKKMFFVVKDSQTNLGELVAGDLNHLTIYRYDRMMGLVDRFARKALQAISPADQKFLG